MACAVKADRKSWGRHWGLRCKSLQPLAKPGPHRETPQGEREKGREREREREEEDEEGGGGEGGGREGGRTEGSHTVTPVERGDSEQVRAVHGCCATSKLSCEGAHV
jgi:hypothetical protein